VLQVNAVSRAGVTAKATVLMAGNKTLYKCFKGSEQHTCPIFKATEKA